jgi:hypothetical protein
VASSVSPERCEQTARQPWVCTIVTACAALIRSSILYLVIIVTPFLLVLLSNFWGALHSTHLLHFDGWQTTGTVQCDIDENGDGDPDERVYLENQLKMLYLPVIWH